MALAVILGVAVLFVLLLAVSLRSTFRAHDPARSTAGVATDADGTFELAITGGMAGSEVSFRFEIAGTNTDDEYAIAVMAELVRAETSVKKVEWHTAKGMQPIGEVAATKVGITSAVTMTSGSFGLLTLPGSGDYLVRGRARAEEPTRLVNGWVYVSG